MSEATSAKNPLLQVQNLKAWYGDSQALHGVNFHLAEGELVTLLGRNGAGKSTILRSIMGILERRTGSIRMEGHELIQLKQQLLYFFIEFCIPGGCFQPTCFKLTQCLIRFPHALQSLF